MTDESAADLSDVESLVTEHRSLAHQVTVTTERLPQERYRMTAACECGGSATAEYQAKDVPALADFYDKIGDILRRTTD